MVPFPPEIVHESSSLGLENILGQRHDVVDATIRMILIEIDQRRILPDTERVREMARTLEHTVLIGESRSWKNRQSGGRLRKLPPGGKAG